MTVATPPQLTFLNDDHWVEFDPTSLIGTETKQIQQEYQRYLKVKNLPVTRILQLSDYAKVHAEWGEKHLQMQVCVPCSKGHHDDPSKWVKYNAKRCKGHTMQSKRRVRYLKLVQVPQPPVTE